MIEINLISRSSDSIKVPVLLGVNLKQVNWIALGLSFLFMWILNFGVEVYFSKKIKEVEVTIEQLENNFKRVDKKVRENEKVRDMLLEFDKVKEDLNIRSQHIREILGQKSNPRRLFERLSEDIPDELWLGKLVVQDKKIEIDGWASSYEDIGKFITQANQSKFFGKSLKLSNEQVKTVSKDIGGKKKNVEVFKIVGDIITFD